MSKKIKSIEEIKKVKRKRASVSQKKAGNPRRNSENTKRPAIKHLVSGAAKGGLTVLISVLIIFTIVQAGSLTPSASPAATGYTLSDIYNRLNTNISSTEANHLFSPSGSPAGTFYTLTEIYNKIPPIVANTVKLGTTYLGVAGTLIPSGGDAAVADLFNLKTANLTADWTLDAGTLNLACNTATFDATGNLVANAYDGAGTGFNRWCITDSGNAVAGNILYEKIVWVDGIAVTGTMPNKVGSATVITPSIADQTITEGYYGGALGDGKVLGDADLVAGNIKSDAFDVFGVSGTLLTNPLYGDNDPTKVLNTAANRGTYDPNTCSTTYDTSYLTVGTVQKDITFGNGLIGDYPSATYTLPGDTAATDAAAGNILSGLEAWTKAGSLLTGAMADKEGDNGSTAQSAASGVNYFTAPAGFYDGDDRVSATDAQIAALDTDIATGNIKSGKTIFGVAGAYSGYPGTGWVANGSGNGSTALTQAACDAAYLADNYRWQWFENGNGDGDTTDPEDNVCVLMCTGVGCTNTANYSNHGITSANWGGTETADNTYIAEYTCSGNFPTGVVVPGATYPPAGTCALCVADCYDGKKDLPDQGTYTAPDVTCTAVDPLYEECYEGPITPEVLKNWKGTRLPTSNDFFGFCGNGTATVATGRYGTQVGRTDEYINTADDSTYEWLSEQHNYTHARLAGNNACSYFANSHVYSDHRFRAVFRP